jgi:hypothetical protein
MNEVTERAVLQAIETAVIDYFKVRDCIVDLETKSVCILFDQFTHRKWIKRFNGAAEDNMSATPPGTSEVPLSIPLEHLPVRIIREAQTLLSKLLAQFDIVETYLKFRSLRGRIVEGTITETSRSHCKVSIIGGTAVLHTRDKIKSETYALGKSLLFLIKQVRLHPDHLEISLSRRSRKIPEYVLKEQFPRYAFLCYRRIPGEKSWIKTTAPRYRWGRFFGQKIRKALAGEHLQFHN